MTQDPNRAGGETTNRVGTFQLVNGVPTKASSEKLYNELDFQRAVQSYLWAMPAVGLKGFENAGKDAGADLDGQFVIYQGYDGVGGIMTPNQTVKYLIGFCDLESHGPAIWEVPAGRTAGYVADYWQRPILDVGITGEEQGAGIKLLIVGPGQDVPRNSEGFKVLQSPTRIIWVATRNMETEPAEIERVNEGCTAYPFNKPSLRGRPMLEKSGPAFIQAQPHGMDFWDNLNEIIQREPVHERDRFFIAMLKPLGIEKGKPFNPDAAQQKILMEAEEVGYLMAINGAFKKRFENATYWEGRNWKVALINRPDQRTEHYDQLDERASWFHEAIGSSWAMVTSEPGPGSVYLGEYEDQTGVGFDGGKNYRLTVPPDAPATQFWSLAVYESHSRTLIRNERKRAEINSTNTLVTEADGSVGVFIGPDAPEGKESNWIQTSQGQNWFTYFRLYGPTKAYFDKTWKLHDIETVD